MSTFLLILGILGLLFMVIALYVFLSAARTFVSEPGDENHWQRARQAHGKLSSDAAAVLNRRSGRDRRKPGSVSFPLIDASGERVERDRRHGERRGILSGYAG
jgi:hypothetical protein